MLLGRYEIEGFIVDKLNENLIKAAFSGDRNKIKKLIQQGADINYKDSESSTSALSFAIRNEHVASVKLLLAHAATIDNEEVQTTQAISFLEELLIKSVTKEWEEGKIVGHSLEEMLLALKKANSDKEVNALLQDGDFFNIYTLLINLKSAKELHRMILEAKMLQRFVTDVVSGYAEKFNFSHEETSKLSKQLYINLYARIDGTLNSFTDYSFKANKNVTLA